MKHSLNSVYFISVILALITLLSACDVASPENVTASGRVKINLRFESSSKINIESKDYLYAQARDFKVFHGENYADVFQNPNQFLEYTDSIVTFNLLGAALKDSVLQVAYGSVPPITYDSLLFQIAPSEFIRLEGNRYPLTTNYNNLIIDNNFTKVIRIKDKIRVEENKTTTINIHLKVEDIVFRVLDDFVFSATVDTFYILND
ncbi:MAG: hypothetical protein COW71_00185 [Ignavibacteriales bacterium CG18_big_fil_WC_8_21_14_2_50_31_20]|nr:MAG: hypothetical protein COW71_00185 [Ignavibacteriales bacterium CG18_big_fil_WC_8_21_14_2_50_31_20]